MNPETIRLIWLMNQSKYFKSIKNKEQFADKLIYVFLFDIGNELKKMDIWLDANPHKRYKNYKKFIVNWLLRKDRPYGK
jgi:hypothetical protein